MTKRIAALSENTAAYHALRRKVKLCVRRSSGLEDITHSANGLDDFHRKILVHLRAQPVNENIDDVGLRIETVIPDVFKDHRFRDHSSRIPQQQFEQGEFAGLQFD